VGTKKGDLRVREISQHRNINVTKQYDMSFLLYRTLLLLKGGHE
jgi:hypothetical protein